MYEVTGWELRRYVTLLVVVALHVALVVALMATAPFAGLGATTAGPIELLYLPPAIPHEVRPENFRPHRLSGNTALAMAMPQLDSAPESSPTAAGSDGNGAGVDWAAEARRALQAFEIRKTQGITNNFNPGVPTRDAWWSGTQHKAGEQYKTPSGDWIVWIDSRCYQVAGAAGHADVAAVAPARTICPPNLKH